MAFFFFFFSLITAQNETKWSNLVAVLSQQLQYQVNKLE